MLPTPRNCPFQDSDGRCHQPQPRGVCSPPPRGASALVQHADLAQLCRRNPPNGFRRLCSEKGATRTLAMLRGLRDPAVCWYKSCAVVGSGGSLLGSRKGREIDSHSAVIRLNFAPDATQASLLRTSPHHHLPTWREDVGERTTWRALGMEGYGYLRHYPRLWLSPPLGHGKHPNMSSIPQQPLLAIACHTPTRGLGRCRGERLEQVFAHPESASYLVNPLLLYEWSERYFTGVTNQMVLSTGMWAIALASQMCGQTHLYGFGEGSCLTTCYHYFDCGPTGGSNAYNQSYFFTDPRASGGYHNFSAQAKVLHRLAAEKTIIPHWGSCRYNLGDAPASYANVPRARNRTSRRRLVRPH